MTSGGVREEIETTKGLKRWRRRLAILLIVAYVIGLGTSLHALMTVRTAQGTIAWVVSLNAMPLFAVPAYWVFGRSKFEGYVTQRRSRDLLADPQVHAVAERLAPLVPEFAHSRGPAFAGQRLAELSYLGGNDVELLIDGEATFASLLAGIDRARKYVLVQFYIV
jgi:cardiolipin synthase